MNQDPTPFISVSTIREKKQAVICISPHILSKITRVKPQEQKTPSYFLRGSPSQHSVAVFRPILFPRHISSIPSGCAGLAWQSGYRDGTQPCARLYEAFPPPD